MGFAFNHSEEVLAGGDEQGNVTLWSLQQGKVARTLEGGPKAATQIAFHPSGSFAAVAGDDLTTRVWDLREKKCVQTYSAHERTTCIQFSPGAGAYIVSGGNAGLSKVWDVRAGKMLTTLKRHKGAVNDIVFHPTELVMATGGEDGVVHFWNAQDYSKIASSTNFKESVSSVSFSSDGKAALAVSDSHLRVMDWRPYALLDSVSAMPWGPVKDAFVRKDKLFVASISKDGKTPSATLLGLTTGIKPFASADEAENVAPVVTAEKKPAEEPAAAAAALAPVESAPQPVTTPVSEPATAPVLQQEASVSAPVVVSAVPEPQSFQQQVMVVAMPKAEPLAEKPIARPVEQSVPKPDPVQEKKRSDDKKKRAEGDSSSSSSRRSGSHRTQPQQQPPSSAAMAPGPSAASNIGNSNTSSNANAGGSRRRKDSTKPSSNVVPSSQVGIVPSDRNTALGLKAQDFRAGINSITSDENAIDLCMADHANMCAALTARKTHVTAIRSLWTKDCIWKAVSQLKDAKDLSVVVDVMGNLSTQQLSIVPLELLNVLLLEIQCLLQAEYEDYCVLGCSLLRNLSKIFGATLKSTREKSSEARNDSVFAERLEIVNVCWESLGTCSLQLRENLQCGGRVGSSSREILALFRRMGV